MLTPRLQRLKEKILNARPEVHAQRALLVTRAYRETEDQPPAIKRAHAMQKIFCEGGVLIKNDELIVGSKTPTPLGSPLYPEFNCEWIKNEIDTLPDRLETSFIVSEETKKIIKEEVIPFWDKKTVYDRILENVPQNTLQAVDEGLFFHYYLNRSIGHITVNYEKVLKYGFKGIRRQITQLADGKTISDPEKLSYYKASIQVVDAVITFARRHADRAEELADKTIDRNRKTELLKIAKICRNVPENPAQSFWEALQSYWFVHLMLNLESNSYAISPGRFDQYIYPFYKKDIEAGKITPEGAQELLNCLWVKFAELTVAKEGGTAKASNTYADFQNLNVGGLKADGADGVNEISYMCLAAQSDLLFPQPQLSCLVSSKSPPQFLLKSCELVRKGTGMPAIYNADELILALTEKGKSLKDARNGGINGCVEITGQGNDHMASSGYVNLAKCLELTLNNGAGMISGRQWGPQTGLADDFKSMDDLWAAYETQISAMVALKHQYDAGAKKAFAQTCPVLCTSLVIDDCLEKAKDFHQGGAKYNLPMMCGVGTGTVADSLAAIDHFVFKKKTFTMNTLVRALKDNFEGHEMTRALLWKKAPKYGNNDDNADKNSVKLIHIFVNILKRFSNNEGVPYAANMIPTTTHLPFGYLTAASPDGRYARMPLAEGISPVQGQDLSGPTAVIRTMGKIDHAATAGTLLNMKFTPQTLAGENNLKKFASLVQSYFDLGGHHLQFNVVSQDTLLRAQQYPDDYRSLLIRVAGYSDFFVNLSKDVQDEVISRTAHKVG
jgi:pyruvate formate-lyase/glycerol dehydratase family glycyl radical enzyme